MKFEIKYGNDVFVVPKKTLLDSLATADLIKIKTLLMLLSEPTAELADYSQKNILKIMNSIGITFDQFEEAVSFWKNTGVIDYSQEKSEAPTKISVKQDKVKYNREEISGIIMSDNKLKTLIDEISGLFGKFLPEDEVGIIVGLCNHLGLSCEYIKNLARYCLDNDKRSIRYIEKTAYSLFDEEINTNEKLLAYIEKNEKMSTLVYKVRKLFGIGKRTLIKKEKEFLTLWIDKYDFSYDMIERAYEITVTNIGEASLNYANKILQSWYENGCKTLDDVDAADIARKAETEKKQPQKTASKKKTQTMGVEKSFDTNQFLELALKRSYANIDDDE